MLSTVRLGAADRSPPRAAFTYLAARMVLVALLGSVDHLTSEREGDDVGWWSSFGLELLWRE
ncbi:hypothetical protein AB0K74_23085 [Streptomyces sp. NPDC056159]|uniref:hypothetical protein n=1 Tax=Streptomyces sp. NPDC056159 TaxID=3155537 RepID=UPI00344A3F1F